MDPLVDDMKNVTYKTNNIFNLEHYIYFFLQMLFILLIQDLTAFMIQDLADV